MNKVKTLFMFSAAILFFAGCGKQQQFKAVEQICVPNLQKQRAMQTAEDVLGKMHFVIAKADTENGLITTKPLTGAQFFEFWRRDNVGKFNSSEANLHTIRRIVELKINRQGTQVCIGCNVNVQRLSLPEHEVTSTSQAYAIFSESEPSMQKLRLNPEQKKGMAWLELGKDTMLATEILKRIEKQIAEPSQQ